MSKNDELGPKDWDGFYGADDNDDDNEIVRAITAIVREADEVFQRVGGSSRHWVRDCFLPALSQHGWFVVKRVTCPCGHGDEPWHYPRNGFCERGLDQKVKPRP